MADGYDSFLSPSGSVDRIDGGVDSRVYRHLRPDERVLWIGGPDPDVRFCPADAVIVPFSAIPVSVLMTMAIKDVVSGGRLIPNLVVAGIVLCFGALMLPGRFFFKRRGRLRTRYAITTKRALIVKGGRSLREVPLHSLPMAIHHSRDGSHLSMAIGDSGRRWMWFDETTASDRPPLFAFYDATDPDALLAALNQAA